MCPGDGHGQTSTRRLATGRDNKPIDWVDNLGNSDHAALVTGRMTGDSSPEQILARFPFGDNLTGMPGFGDQSTSGTLKFHAAPEEESTVNDCVADPDSGRS